MTAASHTADAPGPARRGGFTLVELLIVVIVLAILAGIAIPQITGERTEATLSALMANVNLVGMTVEYHRQKSPDGSWPPAVDEEWFSSKRYPYHPDRPEGVAKVQTVSSPTAWHPANKILSAASPGAYWYNAANGVFRARVRDMGDNAATLEAYNRVNQTDVAALSVTKNGASRAAEPARAEPVSLGN